MRRVKEGHQAIPQSYVRVPRLADPDVLQIFRQLQAARRRQQVSHLLADEARAIVEQRHRVNERQAWARLMEHMVSLPPLPD